MKHVVIGLLTLPLVFTASVSLAVPTLPSGPPSPSKIEGYCNEHGGTYWPPGGESSTYGCILPDGSVIACGGGITSCSTIPASSGLPPTRLPLSVVNLKLQVDSKAQQDLLQDKMDLLELMVDDLSILVKDECEPPIFVP